MGYSISALEEDTKTKTKIRWSSGNPKRFSVKNALFNFRVWIATPDSLSLSKSQSLPNKNLKILLCKDYKNFSAINLLSIDKNNHNTIINPFDKTFNLYNYFYCEQLCAYDDWRDMSKT